MRFTVRSLLLLPFVASTASAAAGGGTGGGLMSPSGGLMFWTLLIFFALFFILKRFAYPPILSAVEAREKALEDAIEGAKRDRDAAAALLAEQRAAIEQARNEAQRYIAEGRAAGEKLRADMLEHTRREQADLLERARRDMVNEKTRAILELRREAVDLAIAGASKVIEKNLDEASNRRLVESFLAGISADAARAGR
jgi:F-type H+-transporting ATPase subunit b